MKRPHSTPTYWAACAAVCLGLLSVAPISLAEQPARSASDPPSANPTPTKKKASASASASSSSQGFAGGLGAGAGSGIGAGAGGGNGKDLGGGSGQGAGRAAALARAKAAAKAKVSASVSTDDDADSASKTAKPSDKSRSASDNPLQRSASTSSRMMQKMRSSNKGTGDKWQRTTEGTLGDDDVTIEESADQIKVSLIQRNTGKERVVIARDLDELKAKSADAAIAYDKLTESKPAVSKAGGAPKGGVPGIGSLPDARELLRGQLKELRSQEGVAGSPLEKLLEDLEEEVEVD